VRSDRRVDDVYPAILTFDGQPVDFTGRFTGQEESRRWGE